MRGGRGVVKFKMVMLGCGLVNYRNTFENSVTQSLEWVDSAARSIFNKVLGVAAIIFKRISYSRIQLSVVHRTTDAEKNPWSAEKFGGVRQPRVGKGNYGW